MRFLEKFVPKETPLVLIGHSIGSYMALQITDKLKDHNVSLILRFNHVNETL